MKGKLDFAQIDLKDCELIGIDGEEPKNKRNKQVIAHASHEYLLQLETLQREINDKYSPMLIENEPQNDCELDYFEISGVKSRCKGCTKEEKEACINEMKPTHLWYS